MRGEFAFQNTPRGDEISFVYRVLRFDKNGQHDHDTKYADKQEQRIFQILAKSVHAEADNLIKANADTCKREQ